MALIEFSRLLRTSWNGLTRQVIASLFLLLAVFFVGCRQDTTLHPITGRVTLDGQGHYRLFVYFRPTKGKPNQYNMGVGETDATGKLTLRSTAGNGLIEGTYRVAFSLLVVPGVKETPGLDEKMDGRGVPEPVEKVPELYADWENSPVMFTVSRGQENYFEFDIPKT